MSIILYNKSFQNKFGFDIEYIKKISGKYRIGEKNGKGKEYILNTNKVIFEGEYLNGKKNGKGREYDEEGHLIFEGEYLNGKIIKGKGICDYEKGTIGLIIEGRKGKEYSVFGTLEFKGEYLNGKRDGFGKEYNYSQGLIYEGSFKNGHRNGKGK